MRMIGQLSDEKAARQFGDALYIRGIHNEVDPENDGSWAIWIHEEEELENASQLLEKFRTNPDDAEFRVETSKVEKRKQIEEKENEAFQKRMVDGRTLFHRFSSFGVGPLTVALMAISILVALISGIGSNKEALQLLFITQYETLGGSIQWIAGLPEIKHGQVWRVFTPMFIHFGPLHILFNMMWLYQLGNLIESRQGTLFFALLVFTISGGSNVAEYFAMNHPNFGGMSGVVFGLFGYIWTKMKFDPLSGYFIDQNTVIWVVAWFFLCMTGLVGNIANVVHAVGLGTGMLWGFLNTKYRRN